MAWTCPRCGTELPDRVGLHALTPMERRVLQAMLDGRGPHKIAAELGTSYNTVRTHNDRIRRKLGVHSQVETVLYAMQHGMSPTPKPEEVTS